ncbi:MAG: molecular chaperone Hsp90 [Peptococcaceae bacterium]|nr:molecular chaperone Hsp90 [Peptococcaceae bacterium]
MEKQLQALITEQANALIAAPMTYEGAKKVAQEWLDAVGTDAEAEATKKLVAEAEADIMPIDGLIAFAGSDGAATVFGDNAPNVLAHAKSIKEAGGRYCDCPACAACEVILNNKEALLG